MLRVARRRSRQNVAGRRRHLSLTLLAIGASAVLSSPALANPAVAHAQAASGSGYCATRTVDNGNGQPTTGYDLGSEFDDVYTCGPIPGVYPGFQCVDYVTRYFNDAFQSIAGDEQYIDYGRNAAEILHANFPQFPIMPSTPWSGVSALTGAGQLPQAGDIISMWGPSTSDVYGHTGVITGTSVNLQGTGTISFDDENATSSGTDTINVDDWTVAYGPPPMNGSPNDYYYDSFQWLELAAALASAR